MRLEVQSGSRSALRRALGAVAAVLAAGALAAPAASAWAPAAKANVHPGVMTFTKGAQCTSNFVFTGGGEVYLGQAAHCSGTGSQTDTDGCTAAKLPLGTRVEIDGASRRGTLVYNSWNSMQARHEKRSSLCLYNDFALIRIAPADRRRVNPSVPGFGGPTGVGTAAVGDTVYSYGNSSLRGGSRQLAPKQGTIVDQAGGGWSRTVYMLTPGIPGDSGSGYMNASGQAIGVLSTLDAVPPAANDIGDLGRELAYMRTHSKFGAVRLARGTRAFDASLANAILGA